MDRGLGDGWQQTNPVDAAARLLSRLLEGEGGVPVVGGIVLKSIRDRRAHHAGSRLVNGVAEPVPSRLGAFGPLSLRAKVERGLPSNVAPVFG